MSSLRSVVAAISGWSLLASSAPAQSPRAQAPDSAATVTVFGVIADALPQDLAVHLWDGGPRPWIIAVPPDTGRIAWSAIAQELRRLLRARDTSATDTRRSVFRVESVTLRGDSVAVEFYIGGRIKCPGAWMATGTWFAGAARVNWGIRSGSTRPTAFEDSFGCNGSGRPGGGR